MDHDDELNPERLQQLIRQLEATAKEAHGQLRSEVEALEKRDEQLTERLKIQTQELTELQRRLLGVQQDVQATQQELIDLRESVTENRRDE